MLPFEVFDQHARIGHHRVEHSELDFDAPDVFVRRQRRDGFGVGLERL